ncbi:BA14K family protein [Rhizobium skierniewicense]|uniref:BA14K family protein n=1 Tax=Rhizobium skierniewicense TaxID=984260 RepID=UPI001572C585|nr:BA14K family protein [Rhizobium skierniewicense]NTF31043.1 BA14K family protein [Rhizobium skierniewicense]
MLNLRKTSVATAVVMLLTSFAPSQAFQAPIPMVKPVQATTQDVVPVQFSYGERRYYRHRDRDFRRSDARRGYYNGHRGYREYRRGYRQHNGYWFPLAAFATGAIIGGAVSQSRPSYGSSHQQWCANRYRSYRAYDNTFQPNNGPRRQCVSP